MDAAAVQVKLEELEARADEFLRARLASDDFSEKNYLAGVEGKYRFAISIVKEITGLE